MEKSVFKITKMDCPSEERMIRMKLDGLEAIKSLDFDLANRQLTVLHEGHLTTIEKSLAELKLNSSLESHRATEDQPLAEQNQGEKKLLWIVLAINFSFFVIEMLSGLLAKSMGLVADSLDMLADALVYGLSLYAVGKVATSKKKVARLSGYFQLVLALLGLAEVARRFFGYDTLPDFQTMIVVSLLALVANSVCLYLLQKSKSQEAHMKASMIFTSNDVVINLGVILTGGLVYWLGSNLPDLIIGIIVFIIVSIGATRILQLSK